MIDWKRVIFMGNGDASAAQAYQLHREPEEAIKEIGGAQQAAFALTDDQFHDAACKVRNSADRIYERLTGRKPITNELLLMRIEEVVKVAVLDVSHNGRLLMQIKQLIEKGRTK